MGTVASRSFRSTPYRDASGTWRDIVDFLIQKQAAHPAKRELLAVEGVASSIIADQFPKSAPIVVTCDGPRTRIYCVYDDEAVENSGGNENPLGFDPLQGDWRISLPCHADDLAWVKSALKQVTTRISVRDLEEKVSSDEEKSTSKPQPLVLDSERFIGL